MRVTGLACKSCEIKSVIQRPKPPRATAFDESGPVAVVEFALPDDADGTARADIRREAMGEILRFLVAGDSGPEAVGRRAVLLAGSVGVYSLRRIGKALGCSHTQAARLVTAVRKELVALQGSDSE